MSRKLQLKRGSKSNMPTLAQAELAYTTDEKAIYFGDGTLNHQMEDVAGAQAKATAAKISAVTEMRTEINSMLGTANGIATLNASKKLVQMPSAADVGAVPESEYQGLLDALAKVETAEQTADTALSSAQQALNITSTLDDDIAAMEEATEAATQNLANADSKYSNALIGTASGNPVQITGAAEGACKVTISGKTTMMGPHTSPETPCTILGITDGKVTVNGTQYTIPISSPLYDGDTACNDGTEVHNTEAKELVGTESWQLYRGYGVSGCQTNIFYATVPYKSSSGKSECTHFVNGKTFDPDAAMHGKCYDVGSSIYLCYGSATKTVADFKAWLASQKAVGTPVTLVFTRVQPITQTNTPVTIKLAQDSSTISSTTSPTIDVEYKRDINVVVNDLYDHASTHPLYGVRFGGSANTGATVTRLYNAAGLVAGVGTDEQTAINDFDNIYPWSARRRCCGYWDDNGNFVVNAYAGEPGYTTDGSNGEVWVEHSLFYYKHTYDGDAEEIIISAFPVGCFLPAPIFIKPDGTLLQKAYTAAYPMATVDGKATSRAGVFSDIHSLNSAMTAARTLGEAYTTTTTAEWYTECLYMWVEFATRNMQSVMYGAASLPYVATDTAVISETGVNRIIVATAIANEFVVGQTIGIGTSLGGTQIASNRIVTAIEEYDADNKAISFDGNPVNIAAGNVVWTAAYINGSCDGVLSSSGSPVNNMSGKYNCVYRGKETPYGNSFEWISDVLFKREGAGTDEDPYSYDIYHLPDPTKYSAGAITANYVKLNFQLPKINNTYVKKLGFDSRYPYLRIPTEGGAGSTTYYADYYYAPAYAVCAANVGGYWINGASAGPCCWGCGGTPSAAVVHRRARLSFHRS